MGAVLGAPLGTPRAGDRLHVTFVQMGGTIDKDYPRATKGYAFEIDDPAAERVLAGLPFFGLPWRVESLCGKGSAAIATGKTVRSTREARARRQRGGAGWERESEGHTDELH